MVKNKFLLVIFKSALIIAMGTFSSCNYLNMNSYFNDLLPIDSIFKSEQYLKGYVYGMASLLPNEGSLLSNSYGPYGIAVDETLLPWPERADYAGIAYTLDHVTPFDDYYNVWGTYYKGIRKCNTILSKYRDVSDLSSKGKDEVLGLTYFARAMFYYRLLELYGPVPILPEEVLDVDESSENLSYPRNTYDECVDYIASDLDRAYYVLPDENTSNTLSRATKGAAMAFKSRILLTASSPWYNGNSYYSSWKTAEGKHFISQVQDPRKWAKAAMAAKVVIESGRYSIHVYPREADTPELPDNVSHEDFPNGAGNIDPLKSYSYMFNGETFDQRNPELIYRATFNRADLSLVVPLSARGWNSWGVTQALVDSYRMADGTDYHPSDDDAQPIGSDKTFSGYVLKGEVAKMFDNREPRFYATIGFCEWYLQGTSLTDQSKDYYSASVNRRVEYYSDGNSRPGANNPDDMVLTGYACIKYLHNEDNFYASVKDKTFPSIRYAEVLLNYVEALNEMKDQPAYTETFQDYSSHTVSYNVDEILKYFNMIRFRAGQPGLTRAEASDQEVMRRLIQRERMIEFAQEGRRYHDVRRWGIAHDTEAALVRGLDVSKRKNQRAEFYKVIPVQHKNALRVFSKKMYFYPIPRRTLDKNKKLIQNPGWDTEAEW